MVEPKIAPKAKPQTNESQTFQLGSGVLMLGGTALGSYLEWAWSLPSILFMLGVGVSLILHSFRVHNWASRIEKHYWPAVAFMWGAILMLTIVWAFPESQSHIAGKVTRTAEQATDTVQDSNSTQGTEQIVISRTKDGLTAQHQTEVLQTIEKYRAWLNGPVLELQRTGDGIFPENAPSMSELKSTLNRFRQLGRVDKGDSQISF